MGNEFLPLLYSFHFYLFGLIAVAAAIAAVVAADVAREPRTMAIALATTVKAAR